MANSNIDRLWSEYLADRADVDARNRLAEHFLPLVKRIAQSLFTKTLGYVSLGDLVSEGFFGLVDAMERFEPERGIKFDSYASSRIRGAMLDGIRDYDRLSRGMRAQSHAFYAAEGRLTAELGREPTESELTDAAGPRPAQTYSTEHVVSAGDVDCLRIEDLLVARDVDAAVGARLENWLAMAFGWLNRNEQAVLYGYYWRHRTMFQIGQAIGLSDSRVSQMHDRAIIKLRTRMAGTADELEAAR